jgi:hypothetical protein
MGKAKREERIKDSAEWVWEQTQLRAANAMQQLGAAQSIFENELKNDDTLSEADIAAVYAQIEHQKSRIEAFLMEAKDTYLKVVSSDTDE